ncbi:hypothetical protein GIB67_039329 [Kingdonia uniflora]|uniref:DUF3598 domain-containing protein n=1 Tax=Kingdonia uniflora TaxID=39325 RepID=A0A7J7LX65_9MAGN|nr:hypothetical protein GIB67_039329 [Kingdonia uniflora]
MHFLLELLLWDKITVLSSKLLLSSMATLSYISVPPMAKTFSKSNPRFISHPTLRRPRIQASQSLSAFTQEDESSTGINTLKSFFKLNSGKWNGCFYQFDPEGNLMKKIATKLAVSDYGEGELTSLIQTLYTKQPQSSTSISGSDLEAEWAEYKIKETNMFTVDKYQQIGFFPEEKAYSLRYQTAGMLETVLRQGVLGEDDIGEESPRYQTAGMLEVVLRQEVLREDDIGEELPRNLKLPSRRPAIVCENCLYSQEQDRRARAFHILDPKGILEMIIVFLEERENNSGLPPSLESSEDNTIQITPFLGRWKGRSITKRSGVYGATIEEADTCTLLEIDDKGQLIQDMTSTLGEDGVANNVHWTGEIAGNLIKFGGGFQTTLLPGGMYIGCPSNVGTSVAQSKSFHLEFCWSESPGKRQRLVRTFDLEGLPVSTTYIFEAKV